jgi:phage gp46-like protein
MDIATVNLASAGDLHFDWQMNGPDLATDDGLRAAVLISLFTDRRAADDDALPDGTDDRRGWWADLPPDGAPDRGRPDLIGSRLWLLTRAKATDETAQLARRYILEALQWMIEDGVAQSIDATTKWGAVGTLLIALVIVRTRNGQPADHRYDLIWNQTPSA